MHSRTRHARQVRDNTLSLEYIAAFAIDIRAGYSFAAKMEGDTRANILWYTLKFLL